MKEIVIRIQVPDGATVAMGEPAVQATAPTTPAPTAGDPVCPIHGTSHYVPAGVSKTKTGKDGLPLPYGAFHGCTERTCSWRVNA
jgi:hypothetical protein